MTHCVSIVFATCVLVQLAAAFPLRMRTHEVVHKRDNSQGIACAIEKLKQAVSQVEIEREVPCETLSHANIQMLLRKLESQVEYAITESIFESLASPEHVNTLVEVMNSTLPVIQTHINSTEDEEEGFNGSVDIPDCSNYLCQDNCSMCIANCAVHRLKRGVVDLIQLVEDDRNLLPQCAVCVEESLQTEAVEIANMLDAIADEMLPRPPENLCPFPQLYHCDQYLELQGRLEMISVWLNDSLISLNGSHSFPNVELLVERLSVGVLPEIRKSLEILEHNNCTDLQHFCDIELPSPEEIILQVNNALSYGACNLEPQLLVTLRTLEILKYNYGRFVRDLLPLVNILP